MNLMTKFRKPYKKRRVSRVSLSEGGVTGAHIVMRPAPLPPPQEVKFFDSRGNGVVTGANWTIISSAGVYGCIIGGGPSQRIGRNIRIIGIVCRGTVDSTATGVAAPWTLDLIQDNQCNSALATVDTMYTDLTDGNALPQPLYDSRYKFLKRVMNKDPQSPYNQFDFKVKTNILIEYKDTTGIGGAITDLTSKNLYMTFTSPKDIASTVDYRLRILYVDA